MLHSVANVESMPAGIDVRKIFANDFGELSGVDIVFDKSLKNIDTLYTTTYLEELRTNFEDTFEEVSIDPSSQGAKFLNGLIDNKDVLMERLDLSEEAYNNLSCVALALATQETGMGCEDGYVAENTFVGRFLRGCAKIVDYMLGNGSASSGLSQMKIYDYLNGEDSPLTQEHKDILDDFGIDASNPGSNNLYKNPDKAAIATVVVLDSIAIKYEEYKTTFDNKHNELIEKYSDDLTEEDCYQKGEQVMTSIIAIYNNASDEDKDKIRNGLKDLFLSAPGHVDEKYNEEIQFEKFNGVLASVQNLGLRMFDNLSPRARISFDSNRSIDLTQISEEELDYLRIYLTSDGQEMSLNEYLAYGWNKGTSITGMQPDRFLAEKVGILLAEPDSYDKDQFTVNVMSLADKYYEQM